MKEQKIMAPMWGFKYSMCMKKKIKYFNLKEEIHELISRIV